MSEGNTIYEITQMMSSEQNIRNDFQEAIELIKNMFHEKYIYKLEKELKRRREVIQKNPSKEIKLISALKPFVEETKHTEIDKIINLMINADTLSTIQKSFVKESNRITAQSAAFERESGEKKDPSIKEDGIYDIDENCLMSMQNSTNTRNNMLPLFLILLLLFFNKSSL